MVSVYEKCFIDRLASEKDVSQKGENEVTAYHEKVHSDTLLEDKMRQQKCLDGCSYLFLNGIDDGPIQIEKENFNSLGILNKVVNSCSNHPQTLNKKIVWHNGVISEINNILRKNEAIHDKVYEGLNKSYGEESSYCKDVDGRNDNDRIEEHYCHENSDLKYHQKIQNILSTEGKPHWMHIKNKRHFDVMYDHQFRDPPKMNRKTFNFSSKNLFKDKQSKKYVNYDEIRNNIRQRLMVFEEWVSAYQPKIVLLGDSHTRFLADIIVEMLPGFKVEATVKPGANTRRVLSSLKDILQDLIVNDFVVIISGTNDMWSKSLEDCKEVMYKAVRCSQNINLILCNVPHNYLESANSLVQNNIQSFNQYYDDLTGFSSLVHLVNLYQLNDRSLFTRHGLHFNHDGKIKICEKISHKILEILKAIKT